MPLFFFFDQCVGRLETEGGVHKNVRQFESLLTLFFIKFSQVLGLPIRVFFYYYFSECSPKWQYLSKLSTEWGDFLNKMDKLILFSKPFKINEVSNK